MSVKPRLKTEKRSGISAVATLCAAAGLVAVPASVLALNDSTENAVSFASIGNFAAFTPASVDPRLAKLVADRTSGEARNMRFTPAIAGNRPDRAVTVAVRVDQETANAISVRRPIAETPTSKVAAASSVNPVELTKTRYDLGLARGFQSFAATATTATLPKEIRKSAMPDLADYKPSAGVANKPSRFGATMRLEDQKPAGRAPRTIDAQGEQVVDVAGSYRVTRNLDVTAGVRYSQDRNAIQALPESEQDSQSVYIGTQFRF